MTGLSNILTSHLQLFIKASHIPVHTTRRGLDTIMDKPQCTLAPDSIAQTLYDDVVSDLEIIETRSTSTSDMPDSSYTLPAAPSTCLWPPPPRFLGVSNNDSDSLATAQSYMERVPPSAHLRTLR